MPYATPIIQALDGQQIRLKQPFDLGFLRRYGRVFKVYDAQASGCLCFGVEQNGRKYFIKLAGAETIHNNDLPAEDTIARLKAAVPKYRDLAHPLLIHLLDAVELENGFALVFDWEDGISFGDQDLLAQKRFLALPLSKRADVFEAILRFHVHVASCGYVAMDFNDNSTLYNFDTGEVRICDIDFYARQSYINGMGTALGDRTIMAPEELRIAGLIDEISNVYTMGATAFLLLAAGDRSPAGWPLGGKLYDVLEKAVKPLRDQRQQSLAALMEDWLCNR